MKIKKIYLSIFCCFLSMSSLHAGYTIVDGQLWDTRDLAVLSPQEHYQDGMEALDAHDWGEAIDHFRKVAETYPDSPFGRDAHYHLGHAYLQRGEIELANDRFTTYLKQAGTGKYFEDAVYGKLSCARAYRDGAKKYMFGSDKLPCIVGANEDATELFDEVLALMPSHEYGAQALYAKGLHLRNLGLYRESVEAFQRLLKQFPDHPDTPGAYIAIVETYLQQAHAEHHNPDVLVLADINIRRFKEAFPRDERVIHCADKLMEIKEIHAKGLFQIGQFYERMKHPQASLIYYANAIRRFPDTQTAVDCKKRLHALKEEGSDYNLPKEWML